MKEESLAHANAPRYGQAMYLAPHGTRSMSHVRRRVLVLASAALVTPAAITPSAGAPDGAPPQTAVGMHDARYCELLQLRAGRGGLSARVWTTYSVNECPPREWNQLNLLQLSWQTRSIVVRNGPRHWLIDRLISPSDAPRPTRTFGGLTMRFGATITGINPLAAKPFSPTRVDRKATFVYDAGTSVFELTDPTGKRYVMQSYSQQTDRQLSLDALASIGPRTGLPAGWAYTARTLTEPLIVDTTITKAAVLQDRLGNSYSLETQPTNS